MPLFLNARPLSFIVSYPFYNSTSYPSLPPIYLPPTPPHPTPSPQTDDSAARQLATALAIQRQLNVAPDGTPVPLTCRQRLLKGYLTTRHRLEKKLIYARNQATDIVESVVDIHR